MACEGCNQSGSVILGFSQLVGGGDCQCTDCEQGSVVKTSCVYYGGPNLNNTGIETCDDMNTVLSKIDQALSATLGDYSTYNKYCVDDGGALVTEQQFVEKISEYVCTLNTSFNTFVNTTYTTFSGTTSSRLTALEVPGITCAVASIVPTDGIATVYGKLCTTLTNLNGKFDLTGVDWSQCFTVLSTPTNLVQAFDTLIDQICLVKATAEAGGTTLPTFNNLGSCLALPVTSTDSLVDTVNKIKNKLCTLPTFDAGFITNGCVTSASTLQGYVQNTITKLTALSQASIVQVSSDFNLVPVNGGDACQGFRLELSSTIADSKFGLNPSDVSPGTFNEKVVAGTGVSFDFISQPGKVVINSSGGSGAGNGTVKVDLGDGTASYLEEKVQGNIDILSGISINISVDQSDPSDHKLVITPSIDLVTLLNSQFDVLESNTTLKNRFCQLVNSCPSNCPPPTNVQVIYAPVTSTTTTSTTTTTAGL